MSDKPTIYTFGCSSRAHARDGFWLSQELRRIGESHLGPIVDIRDSRKLPGNPNFHEYKGRHWARDGFYDSFCYRWMPELGNPSKALPWSPVDRALADSKMFALISEFLCFGNPIILMCVEKDPKRCHRTFVAEAISDRVPGGAEIVHL